tara:strand:- start:642 stop:4124 length:3483 start_codon:yes stop_codon:yes gene_type:complete
MQINTRKRERGTPISSNTIPTSATSSKTNDARKRNRNNTQKSGNNNYTKKRELSSTSKSGNINTPRDGKMQGNHNDTKKRKRARYGPSRDGTAQAGPPQPGPPRDGKSPSTKSGIAGTLEREFKVCEEQSKVSVQQEKLCIQNANKKEAPAVLSVPSSSSSKRKKASSKRKKAVSKKKEASAPAVLAAPSSSKSKKALSKKKEAPASAPAVLAAPSSSKRKKAVSKKKEASAPAARTGPPTATSTAVSALGVDEDSFKALSPTQINIKINEYIDQIRKEQQKFDEIVPPEFQFPVLNNIGTVIKADPKVPKRQKLDKNNNIIKWAKDMKKTIDNKKSDNDSPRTFKIDLKSITTNFDVSPFTPFIIMSEDLGYALNFKFKERMLRFVTEDKLLTGDKLLSYDSKIKGILDKDSYTIRSKITELAKTEDYNEKHKKIQFFIDAIDLIHDVAYAKKEDKYIKALTQIADKHGLGEEFSDFTKKILNKSNSTIQKEVNDMRKQKRKELIALANENYVPIPDMEETPLTLMEGYFEFFDIMKKYNGESVENMTYFESGRKFKYGQDFNNLVAEYHNNGDNFDEDCSSYCNINKNEVSDLKEKLKNGNPYVETKPCTTIDGFGLTNKELIKDDCQIYTFYNVFGRFNYKIHTFFHESKWKHIIMIYDNNDENLVAIFTFYGNGTIDSLLSAAGMVITRNGDGGKGGILNFDKTINEWNDWNRESNHKNEIIVSVELSKTNNRKFGKYDGNYEQYYELLLIGVKTCGDLVVYQYNKDTSLHFVGTTDKGIAFSNEIDFLQPVNEKKEVLMGVMRRDGNGWLYTKGIEKVNNKIKSEQIIIKLISYYHFLSVYDNNNGEDRKNARIILEDNIGEGYSINTLKSKGNTEEENVDRFYQLKEFRENTFKTKTQYKGIIPLYELCMLEILIKENEAIKKSIDKCISTASDIFKNYKKEDIGIWEKIVKLPNLNDAFSSKVSKIAQNHETISKIFTEVPKKNDGMKEGHTDEYGNPGDSYKIQDSTINVKIQGNDIIIYYVIDSNLVDHTVNGVTFEIKRTGIERVKTNTLYITSPITLDLLIQLLEKSKDNKILVEKPNVENPNVENPNVEQSKIEYHTEIDSTKIISEEIDRIFAETFSLASLDKNEMEHCQVFYKDKLKDIGYQYSSI